MPKDCFSLSLPKVENAHALVLLCFIILFFYTQHYITITITVGIYS